MNSQTKPFTLLHLLLLLFTTLTLTPPTQSTPDYTTLVYKGCANQRLPDPTPLSSLYTTLISQSTTSKFFKTTQSTITALFQCRGDLTNIDCHNCITQIPTLIKNLCGSNPSPNAARIQLLGCYMHYEADGFPQISGLELLYKKCGPTSGGGPGFAERRGAAFAALEGGFAGGGGFYATSYEGVYVVGQCEGDLGSEDCGKCVKSGVERGEVECGGSVFGQIYLHKCFVGYSYYPNGVPRRSSEHSSPGTFCFFENMFWHSNVKLRKKLVHTQ